MFDFTVGQVVVLASLAAMLLGATRRAQVACAVRAVRVACTQRRAATLAELTTAWLARLLSCMWQVGER